MKVTLTNREVINLWNTLNHYQSFPKLTPKFAYSISVTKSKLKDIVDGLGNAQKVLPEYEEYNNKRLEICNEFVLRDDEGNPKTEIVNGQEGYMFDLTKKVEYEAKFLELNTNSKKVLEAQSKLVNDFNSLLNDQVEVELHTVTVDMLPPEIAPTDLEVLLPMLTDNS